MSLTETVVERAKKKVQKALERAEEEKRRNLLRKRIELAHEGVRAYQSGKVKEAAQYFHGYLRILEDWKNVKQGGLHPGLFSTKKEFYELLLIAAIYWDLSRIYDNTSSSKRHKDFKHYMEKYLLFSKGMPFQSLCTEMLRKYITNGKAKHQGEFKRAFESLGGHKCFVATALIDVTAPNTLGRLREFRDSVLTKNTAGRVFINWYYRNGPKLAKYTDQSPQWLRRVFGAIIDQLAALSVKLSRSDLAEK